MTRPIATADIGIIVLAAGAASRFGADKRRAVLGNGQTVLEATLASIPASFTRRILVLKADDDDLVGRFQAGWQICIANAPESGMANSLTNGIALAGDWQGALIALADMPHISPATYAALQEALTEHPIVIPTCAGTRGNPAGFRQAFFSEFAQLAGDKGAKSLLQKYAGVCFECETGDEGVLRDIDTPEELS
jgi:molybdenum cofactor cytidylyltransferase